MKVVIALFSLIVGPVFCVDDHLETVLAVTQCRASCLDQFSHVIRTEDYCRKDSNCLMCWETCQMLIENFKVWSPLCAVPDVCQPGCQKACSFSDTKRNQDVNPTEILLRSVYESYTDRVNLEWDPHSDLESEGAVIYSVLLKDYNQKWSLVAQTTSHVVHLKRGLFTRNTTIRVIAANATNRISDSRISYLNSFITGSSFYNAGKRDRVFWKPHLESMVQNEKTIGLLTTVTWTEQSYKSEPTQYEVSWNVIDDSIEITGHLYTSNNAAVLTLWPDSLYSVQVNSYTTDKGLYSQSEPLIIDTRNSHKETRTPVVCTEAPGDKIMNTLAFVSALFVTFIFFAFVWVCKRRKAHFIAENGSTTSNTCDTIQHMVLVKNTECQRNNVMKNTKENYSPEVKSEVYHIV